MAVASGPGQTDVVRRRRDRRTTGLEGVLDALDTLHPGGSRAPRSCTWVCRAVVGDAHDRHRGAHPGADPEADPEFDVVLVRRLAWRYLRTAADAAAADPVARAWQLLLDPPPVPAARLAVAGVDVLLGYDLTLAFAGTCTVLGRRPGSRERAAHTRVAAALGSCARELARRSGGPVDAATDPGPVAAAVARLQSPTTRDTARGRAEHLWTLRGRPAEAEAERAALDAEVRARALGVLSG